jgi:hypothetical protein
VPASQIVTLPYGCGEIMVRPMSTFRVCFDGRWQEDFDTLADAVEWAQDVALTGRTVLVVERGRLSHHFRAAFPEERAEEAKREWARINDWRQILGAFGAGFNSG